MAGTLENIYLYNFNGIAIPNENAGMPEIDWDSQFLNQGTVLNTIKFIYPKAWDSIVNSPSVKWFTGNELTGINNNSAIEVSGSKEGDIYLNINQDSNSYGNIYVLSSGNTWVYSGNIINITRGDLDETLKQTVSSDNSAHPILASASTTPNTGVSSSTIYNPNIYMVPSKGKLYAKSYQTLSDIRKKDIIESVSVNRAYELAKKCHPVLYAWKDSDDVAKQQEIGLIAQEVNSIFPEIVDKDKDGYLTIDYSKLSVVLLSVIQDLTSKIDVLCDRIDKLENKISE